MILWSIFDATISSSKKIKNADGFTVTDDHSSDTLVEFYLSYFFTVIMTVFFVLTAYYIGWNKRRMEVMERELQSARREGISARRSLAVSRLREDIYRERLDGRSGR